MYINKDESHSAIQPIMHKTKDVREKILKKAAQDTLMKEGSTTNISEFDNTSGNNKNKNNPNNQMRQRSSGTFHAQGENKYKTGQKFSRLQGSPGRNIVEKTQFLSKKIDPLKTVKLKEKAKAKQEMEFIEEATPKSEFRQSGFENKSKELSENSNNKPKILDPIQVEQLKKQTEFFDKLSNTDKDFFKKGTFKEDWENRQKKKDNLFMEAKIYGQVPIVNPDGSIPRDKIVGKPEWFIKSHLNSLYNQEKSNKFQNNTIESSNNSQQQINSINDAETSSIKSTNQGLNINSFRNQRSFTFAHRNQNLQKHKLNQRLQNEKLNKDQVVKEIHDVIIRVSNNKKSDQQMTDMMSSNKNYSVQAQQLDKEQRIFQNFNQQQGIWKYIIQKNTNQVKRNYENSILFASDTYRSKVETVKALDNLISDSERYGNTYWEKTLRSNEKQKNLQQIQEEQEIGKEKRYPHGFNNHYDFQERKEPQLEIIRKPKSNVLKGKYEGISNFTTFKSDGYFRKKFQNCSPEKLEQIKHLDDREYDNLEIQGQSKLQMEITNLLEDENTKHFKKIDIKDLKEGTDKDNGETIKEEIIALNYDKQHLTQMPALSFKKFDIKY